MRFAPVASTKQEYDDLWYIAQGFGEPTDYGYHEGIDLNLNTGGDSDLGQPLYALAAGNVSYYHYATHPATGYGRHLLVRIVGEWGTRWCHYAHLQEDGFSFVKPVAEGQQVGTLGKSGTTIAHLHFAIWKTDPAGRIDMVARNLTELHANWENPLEFIERWYSPPVTIGDDSLYDFGQPFGVMRLVDAAWKMQGMRDSLTRIGEIVDAA